LSARSPIHKKLVAKGWDDALEDSFPDRKAKPKNPLTVGDLIETVRPLLGVRLRTFEIYAYALRKIAREATGRPDKSKHRFDPKARSWRRDSGAILLAKLTPNSVADWKTKVVSESGANPVDQARARRNVNSFIRNARALFGRKALKRLKEKGVNLPSPLPFEGVELEEQGNTKYRSTFDPKILLQEAKKELQEKDIDTWAVILLGLGAGLRRKEIDGLCWQQLDFQRSEIHVFNHEGFQAKTDDSEGKIYVDPGLMAELLRLKDKEVTAYVVESATPGRSVGASQYYRAGQTFEKVTTWLRAHGVTGDKPLHSLRKEFGSIICESADIHTASRQLRHSNLATTAAFYTDHRRRVTVPVGALLIEEAKPDKEKHASKVPAATMEQPEPQP
jgi:integrase